MNININNCFFQRFSPFNGNGGVINVNISGYSLVITQCNFISCQVKNTEFFGGAIYFSSTSATMSYLCCLNSSARNHCFSLISTSGNNFESYLSLSSCKEPIACQRVISTSGSNVKFDYCNFSRNYLYMTSTYGQGGGGSFLSQYGNYIGNNASYANCIGFWWNSGTFTLSNIVENDSPFNYGIFLVSNLGSYTISYCIIQNNKNT